MRRRWPWLSLAVVLAVVAGVVALQAMTPDEAPDVVATAQSADVSAADRAATTRVDAALAEVIAPWLDPLGDEVADGCFTDPPSTPGGDQGQVRCDRTVVRYFGFDGDFADRVGALTTELTRAGWTVDLRPTPDQPTGRASSKRAAQWLAVAWAQRPQPVPPITELDRPHQPHDPVVVYREAQRVNEASPSFRQHQVVIAVGITDRYFGA